MIGGLGVLFQIHPQKVLCVFPSSWATYCLFNLLQFLEQVDFVMTFSDSEDPGDETVDGESDEDSESDSDEE